MFSKRYMVFAMVSVSFLSSCYFISQQEQSEQSLNDQQLLEKGEIAHSNKEFQSAYNYYSKAIKANPRNAKAYSARAWIHSDLASLKAIHDLTKAIELEPGFSQAYYDRGISYQNLGICQKADLDYQSACKSGYKPACSQPKCSDSFKEITEEIIEVK